MRRNFWNLVGRRGNRDLLEAGWGGISQEEIKFSLWQDGQAHFISAQKFILPLSLYFKPSGAFDTWYHFLGGFDTLSTVIPTVTPQPLFRQQLHLIEYFPYETILYQLEIKVSNYGYRDGRKDCWVGNSGKKVCWVGRVMRTTEYFFLLA